MTDAVDYIIQAFEQCNIISLGEGAHGLENFHQFLLDMLENSKIQEMIDV